MDINSRFDLLVESDQLATDIAKSILSKENPNSLENYLAHCLGNIRPAVKMLLWGIDEDQSLGTMNALRTLLENWANLNYVLQDPQKTEGYAKKIEDSAFKYKDAFDTLLKDSSQGLASLTSVKRWSGKGPIYRVEKLGEGPLFQYEMLSRYAHADVWTVINDYSDIDRQRNSYVFLGWGVEFINHTIWIVYEKNLTPDYLDNRITTLNENVSKMFAPPVDKTPSKIKNTNINP